MACKEPNYDHVCRNYVLLKPKEAGFAELVRLLFCTELGKRSCVECSEEEGREARNFRRRWLIFVSIVAQKLFLLLSKPMALLGHVLVSWLNLVAVNGGLFGLLRNLFKGNNNNIYQSLLAHFVAIKLALLT